MNFEKFCEMADEIRYEQESNLLPSERIKKAHDQVLFALTDLKHPSDDIKQDIINNELSMYIKMSDTVGLLKKLHYTVKETVATEECASYYKPTSDDTEAYMLPIVDLSISARPSEDSFNKVKAELSRFCEKMGV